MNAARADGLFLPPVEIGYAPLYVVRDRPPHADSTVIKWVKFLTVTVTLFPPALGAIALTAILILGSR